MLQANILNIGTESELDQYITMAYILRSWAEYSNMCAYVREVHLLAKEAQNLIHNAALIKWKTPNWVSAEARC